VNTRTQAFVLVVFGGALLRLAMTDALLRYVRPIARPWVLLAGLAFLGLGLWSMLAGSRGSDRAGHDEARDEHGHHNASRAAWLVLAPVIAILVVAPPALGAFTAKRVPFSEITPPTRHFSTLPSADPVRVSLLDYCSRAAFGGGPTLTGHRIALTGFVLRPEPGGFQIARLVITCCAADALPVVVSVQTPTAPPARDTWVTVTGTYAGMSPSDATVPVLHADTTTPITQPANPYD
jgi:uncharacterized repeat protein (TIGR03943 family)